MALYKIGDRYPNYRNIYFEGGDLKGMNVYSAQNQAVGQVSELLIDDTDRLKYLVVNLQDQKQVLLPVRSCVKTTDLNSLYAREMSSDDISRLPTYQDGSRLIEETIEENSSTVTAEQRSDDYQTVGYQMAPVEYSAPVEMTSPVASVDNVVVDSTINSTVVEQTVVEQTISEPGISEPGISEPIALERAVSEPVVSEPVVTEQASIPDSSQFLLYEERLSTRKQRVRTGEVRISRQTVTETTETLTPVKKEKIIIEIESIYGGDTQIDVDNAEVGEDGSISMGIYEERAEICRQVRPYQSISVRKETVEDVVKTQETLRREELSVNPDGLPYVDWVDE